MNRIKKKYLNITPQNGIDYTTQLQDCYRILEQLSIDKNHIIKQIVFIKTKDTIDYLKLKKEILEITDAFYIVSPPTSVVSQIPCDNGMVMLQLVVYENIPHGVKIEHKDVSGIHYLIIHWNDSTELIVSGITLERIQTNIFEQSLGAFEKAELVLQAEGMDFSNIVRQWNYIENITEYSDKNAEHYQIFNDVRSSFYSKCNFTEGYPSATGIGTFAGGVMIDFIALKHTNEVRVISIGSPLQIDAHAYNHEVLGNNNSKGIETRTSPKFERAKYIHSSVLEEIYISGTAAIVGQNTIVDNRIETQTHATIDCILNLVSPTNLAKYTITKGIAASFSYFVVYVKYEKDIDTVRKICCEYFPTTPIQFINTDICRKNLLLEIEGMMSW